MSVYLDSSILVAALVEDEARHEACLDLLKKRNLVAWTHALAETYATLTGGRLGIRVAPAIATQLIESLVPRLRLIDLSATDMVAALRECDPTGVRGGALFDFLHLQAARKASAATLFTIDVRHFVALARAGDPEIASPV